MSACRGNPLSLFTTISIVEQIPISEKIESTRAAELLRVRILHNWLRLDLGRRGGRWRKKSSISILEPSGALE